MPDIVSQSSTRELAQKRKDLSPDAEAAFQNFSQTVFADGALPAKVKQTIAVAVAHVTQCPYCIKGHTKARTTARRLGTRADGGNLGRRGNASWSGYAHSVLAIEEMKKAGTGTSA